MTAPLAIEAHGLTRRFGSFTAVDDADISVRRGSIYGFLGPNGAGKSTAIRMLTGLLRPSAGSIRIEGIDVRRRPEKAKRIIGYMTQHFSLYEDLAVGENLEFYRGVYGGRRESKGRLSEALELEPYLSRLASEVPGGVRQKLMLACVLMHDPSVLFLDEPTAGVDPVSRRGFWDIINGLSHGGTTVFLTTHFLDEAEYCHDLGFIRAGRVIEGGTPRELRRRFDHVRLFEVEVEDYAAAEKELAADDRVHDTYLHGPRIHAFAGENVDGEEIGRRLEAGGFECLAVRRIPPSMEDIFIMLTSGTDEGGEDR